MLFGWDPEPAPPHPHATHVLQRMATLSLAIATAPSESRRPRGGGARCPRAARRAALGRRVGRLLRARRRRRDHVPDRLPPRAALRTDCRTRSRCSPAPTSCLRSPNIWRPARTRRSRCGGSRGRRELGRSATTSRCTSRSGRSCSASRLGDPTRFRLAIGDGALDLPRRRWAFSARCCRVTA